MQTAIDVIIPVWKPPAEFYELIAKLGSQETAVRRICLVETVERNGESALDESLLEKLPLAVERREILRESFDHAGARMTGAETSDADYLLFMTQDAMPAGDLLVTRLLEGIRSVSDCAACYARQLPKEGASQATRITQELNYPPESSVHRLEDLKKMGVRALYCSNVCALYDHRIFDRLGGFAPPAVFNEDMVFAHGALKAGYCIRYEAGAEVVHSHEYTAGQQFRRNFDLGVSQGDRWDVFADARSEGEGVRYVLRMLRALAGTGSASEIPVFIGRCAARYAGFKLGKNHRHLPAALIRRWTQCPQYPGFKKTIVRSGAGGL